MKYIRCFNLGPGGQTCKVLKVTPCPEDCFAKVTDPQQYIKTLEDLMFYNWDTNPQMVANLRKEINVIRERYNLAEPEYEKDLKAGKFADWERCYYEDLKRRRSAKGGGSSEKNTNPSKPRENDNRIPETKLTAAEREKLKKATEEWELEHGKLPKLGYTSMSRSKIDSYTGEPIE